MRKPQRGISIYELRTMNYELVDILMKQSIYKSLIPKIDSMKRSGFLPGLIVLFFACLGENASAQFRKYSNEFLNIGAGARGLAMASAQIASVSDGTSGYWNPAGLVNVKDYPQLNLMH